MTGWKWCVQTASASRWRHMQVALPTLTLAPSCTHCLEYHAGVLSRLPRKDQGETGLPRRRMSLLTPFPQNLSPLSPL